MFVAVHPREPSPVLADALEAAGAHLTGVGDAGDVVEYEPADGWTALVVETGDDPTAALSVARRVHDDGVAVLLVVDRAGVAALPSGGYDDFVVTPLDPKELAARLARLAAASSDAPTAETISFKDLELNLATYQARVAGRSLDLTYMEYELLAFFAGHPARVWSREQLLSRVWGYDYFGGARTVDVHVRRLRAKLGEERAGWITTVRSVGYRFG
jgi:DNA-binding response OmpR family regulator